MQPLGALESTIRALMFLQLLAPAGGDQGRTSNGNRQKKKVHSAHRSFLSSGLKMVKHTRHRGKTP